MGQSRRNKKRKPPHRITRPSNDDIEEFKKLLGLELAAKYMHAQLIRLNMEFHVGSELFLELYRQRRIGQDPSEEI